MDDMIGKTFNRFTVKAFLRKNEQGSSVYLCECSCGKKREARRSDLTRGNLKSCGCLSKEMREKRRAKIPAHLKKPKGILS